MVSFLDLSQMRVKIANGFRGKLLVGVLTRVGADTVDGYGDPVPGASQTFRVEGFADEYSEVYKAQAGIPFGDSKVTLIAGLMSTDPLKDDYVQFPNFPRFQVRSVKTDPAKAAWELQVFRAKA